MAVTSVIRTNEKFNSNIRGEFDYIHRWWWKLKIPKKRSYKYLETILVWRLVAAKHL